MKILFWTGYDKIRWDKGTWENNGIGGSEYCVLKLADYLDLEGHEVTISGEVQTGHWYGVDYTHYNELKQGDHYDVVIAINYIHYHRHLEELSITYGKNIFWMHNEYFFEWYRGEKMDGVKNEVNKIDVIVGVSEFHANILKEKFKALHYTPTKNDTYIRSIDNAICLYDYKGLPNVDRVKNRIIWSSSPDRGLKLMLDNWTKWRALIPDLTLEIFCPPYAVDWFNEDVSKLEGVTWRGNASPKQLKIEILKSEYWVYASDYLETYCISCLEMMMGGVRILTNGTGNIMNLIGNGDRGVICDMNPDTIIETIMNTSDDTWREKTTNAYEWAVKQNWGNRVNDWIQLIKQ
jgi:glycosyltransferase involved in cell wall biosynthesis